MAIDDYVNVTVAQANDADIIKGWLLVEKRSLTTGTNSKGTAADVAALTKRFTVNGAFTTTSTPTLAEVESFIDTVSAWINTALAKAGFTVPITQADVKTVLAGMAVQAASDLVQAANSSVGFSLKRLWKGGLTPCAFSTENKRAD
jgi:hypothetical protein